MADLRRYTGTQRLQILWTFMTIVAAVVVSQVVVPETETVSLPVALIGTSLVWMVGLVSLGLRERRHWNKMVDASSFDLHEGTRSIDIEKLLGGRSVTVSTSVPGILSQTHTEIRTTIDDVDATFTIQATYVGSGAEGRGVTTGNETLDETFVFEGTEQNLAKLLSPEVQATLMDVETPGTCIITSDRVKYEIPFTRLSTEELETISDVLVKIAERIEDVAKS
jgi:hypothetical protein